MESSLELGYGGGVKVWHLAALVAAIWWLIPRYRVRAISALVVLIGLVGL